MPALECIRSNPIAGYTYLMIQCDLITWQNELARLKRDMPAGKDTNIAYYEGMVDGIKKALECFEVH